MFMRTLGLRIGLGLGLGLGIGLVFGFSGPTSIEGGKNFFSAPCAFISCILHVTCALLTPPHTPPPFTHTHNFGQNWYVWSENTMFMLVYAY